ncbi:F-box only protein 16-like isoform X1 [Haliotis rufescens]|uniref:F-box only protein 16-like isoform X1 n=1 Tax=Haliotis rufescens TaxID=6454 RepID=UPI001EAFAC04|nr:F-box only protein 16-like isoform X1 [Haliotis rufescens]
MSMIAKNRTKSTWTPLSNDETNNKIFEERRILVGKWYDRWSDDQRRRLLEDLVMKSKNRQLDYARDLIKEKVPALRKDFTRVVPRVVSLYIMSYLDPRSLCRCSRVCWYWKYLSELDQLWMIKCLRLGWFLSFTPSPFENGVWKRNYLEHIKSLQVLRPAERPYIDMEKLNLHSKRDDKNRNSKKTKPWRGSDPVPKDTWRYNVLENDDVVQDVGQMRKKKRYPGDDSMKNAKSKLNTHQSLSLTRRSQSMSRLHTSVTSMTSPDRPKWAVHTTGAPLMNRDSTLHNGVASTISRPQPVGGQPKTPKSFRPIRSERDPPSSDLFPSKPWKLLDGNLSDEN